MFRLKSRGSRCKIMLRDVLPESEKQQISLGRVLDFHNQLYTTD